jgi:hypothetical protein
MKIATMGTLALGCLSAAGSAFAGSPPMALPQVINGGCAPTPGCSAAGSPNLVRTNPSLLISPTQALTWATFKNGLGPTYTGSVGGLQWANFVMTTAQEFGGVNIFVQQLPYSFYTVNDWPNPLTHVYGSGVEVEKMVYGGTNGTVAGGATPVPVVASYGMTSGATQTTGLNAPMVYCPSTVNTAGTVTTTCTGGNTPANLAGKIMVCPLPTYPAASPGINGPYSYTSGIMGQYSFTDAEVRYEANPVAVPSIPAASVPPGGLQLTPGGYPLFAPTAPSSQTAMYYRWNFTQVSGCLSTAKANSAGGMVWVYDVSPGGAFGNLLREVYNCGGAGQGNCTAASPAAGGPGTLYQNIPTLILDRVNGAPVLTSAQSGQSATIWLLPQGVNNNCNSTGGSVANGSPSCGFVPVQGFYVVAYLPGKYYGTPQDQYIDIATHMDAQSLVEEDGALGMLGMMNYFNQIPQSQRPRTLQFWFDSRHFMPGAEGQWSIYDYLATVAPQQAKPVVGYMSLEHMGGRNTQETGTPDGLSTDTYPNGFIGADTYSYVNAAAQDGGDIDSLLNISNNNLFLINTLNQAASDNNWLRVFGASGGLAPGLQGGYQKTVNSAELKGAPGIGLAGDWPGAWTQEYSQIYTEASCTPATQGTANCSPQLSPTGAPGFDENYFTAITGGMVEIAGKFMAQANFVIATDAGWGNIAAGLLCTSSAICTTAPASGQLPNTSFITSANATTQRASLVSQYQTAFQYVQQGQYRQAINALNTLEQEVNSWVSNPNATQLDILIGNQIQKLLTQPQVYTHDFNGDGDSDVLWRDSQGNVGTWLMNASSILQGQVIGNVPLNWSIVGQRDFTGNGNADLLWRDTSGNLGMWLMNGGQIAYSVVIGNVPTTWSVAGTGDFNGDGIGDILWRDTSGNVGIWLMNGSTVIKSAVVGNVPTNWVISGSDMHGDIFWRNTLTGEVGMWVMNGTTISQTVDFGAVPTSWSIAGIGDFANSGSTDLLWVDNSGNVGMWLMNGTAIQSTAVLGKLPAGWSIAATGDYNGDGKTDVLLTDTVGDLGVWFMDGATIASTTTYGNVGTSWTVQAMNGE